MQFVLVCQLMSDHHQIVVQNVSLTAIVKTIWHVSNAIVQVRHIYFYYG